MRAGGINRCKGYKYVARILKGADDGAVKIIPLSYEGGKTYLIYISKSRYGYLEFSGYGLVKESEYDWPPPPVIRPENIVSYKDVDPNAYYEISALKSISAIERLNIGDDVEVGGLAMLEAGRARITGEVASEDGKLDGVAAFDVLPRARTYNGLMSQQKAAVSASGPLEVSYFNEYGAGEDLQLSCDGERQDLDTTLKFTILNPGSGFKPDVGQTYTTLKLRVEEIGVILVKGAVSSNGQVTSVNNYKVYGFPETVDVTACVRYKAPPPDLPDLVSDVVDHMDRAPDLAPNIRVWVNPVANETGFPTIADVYDISFGEEDVYNPGYGTGVITGNNGGRGYKPINAYVCPDDPPAPPPEAPEAPPFDPGDPGGSHVFSAALPTAAAEEPEPAPYSPPLVYPAVRKVFLQIRHTSDVGGEMCDRVIRCIGTLDNAGAITYIEPIHYWIDDDCVLAEMPDNEDPYSNWDGTSRAPYEPGSHGGVFQKLRNQGEILRQNEEPASGTSRCRLAVVVSAKEPDDNFDDFGFTICPWHEDVRANYNAAQLSALKNVKEGDYNFPSRNINFNRLVFYVFAFYGTWYMKGLITRSNSYSFPSYLFRCCNNSNEWWVGEYPVCFRDTAGYMSPNQMT
jgi:hypothetical protein